MKANKIIQNITSYLNQQNKSYEKPIIQSQTKPELRDMNQPQKESVPKDPVADSNGNESND